MQTVAAIVPECALDEPTGIESVRWESFLISGSPTKWEACQALTTDKGHYTRDDAIFTIY